MTAAFTEAILATLTRERRGKPASLRCSSGMSTSSRSSSSGMCEVTPSRRRSSRLALNQFDEMTTAGRRLVDFGLVIGKGVSTTSPWLKRVVDGVVIVIPELERRLRQAHPGEVLLAQAASIVEGLLQRLGDELAEALVGQRALDLGAAQQIARQHERGPRSVSCHTGSLTYICNTESCAGKDITQMHTVHALSEAAARGDAGDC